MYIRIEKDPSLPIHMDYSPELDPEIHGFLREQQSHQRHSGPMAQLETRGSVATHCELRLILDGLEKLGFQLVTTASYNHKNRSHNEFIMHRELSPSELKENGGHHNKSQPILRHHQHQHQPPPMPMVDPIRNANKHHHHHHRQMVNRSESSASSSDNPIYRKPNKPKSGNAAATTGGVIKEPYKVKNYSNKPSPGPNNTSYLYY